METLVIVAEHRNQYHRRGKFHLPESFGSSPSRGFKEINCRTFQSGTGILPTPFKPFNSSSSLINKKACPSPTSSPHKNSEKHLDNNGKSIPIPIKVKPGNYEKSLNDGHSLKSCNSSSPSKQRSSSPLSVSPHRENNVKGVPIPINFKPLNTQISFIDDFSYSELWAGPAYSNSPPPSSLPIPTFSLRQKRSVSVEFPVLRSEVTVHHVAKSAPPSPTRGLCRSPDNFCLSTASATKDLRRILHLDAGDE